jgi:putative ABC transport system permease protein
VIPGVRAAGMVAGVPLVAPRGNIGIELEGHPVAPGSPHPQVNWQVITPGYLEAIGMRLQLGRSIDRSDVVGRPGAVLINQAMAEKFWPGDNPLGRRFKLGGGAKPDTVTVVGVVGDVHQSSLGESPGPEMYFAHAQFRFWGGGGMLRSLNVVVRTSSDPRTIVPALRREIAALAPSLPIGEIRTLTELRSQSVALPRFLMLLLLAVAAVALVIAVVGLYALVAHSVVVRRKEFGIRMALGAERMNVIWLVTREGALLTITGLVVGIPTALAFASLLRRFLFDVRPADPVVLAAVAATLALVATTAAYLPARRAAATMPVIALRGE